MISWIQHHLIRHGRWIFLVLLGIIIVAFVFTIGNTPGCTSNRNAYKEVHFYGYDLNSPHEMEALGRKLAISNQLNRIQIQSDQQYQSLVTSRIALLHLADKIGIPTPDQAAIGEFIKTRKLFIESDGQYSRDAMTRFIDTIETEYPADGKGLVLTVFEEDYRIESLTEALAGPGYLLPSEARAQTQRNRTELKLTTATLDYKTFEPEIQADETALEAHYDANTDRYQIAERIDASYITFPAQNYLEKVEEATDEELREYFITNRDHFIDQYEAEQAVPEISENEDVSKIEKLAVQFEDVRDEFVIPDFRQEQASRLANRKAQTFAYTLYSNSVERDTDTFNTLLNQTGLSLKKLEPFTAKEASQRALPYEMLESAFALNDSKYYSDPYPISDDYAILIFQGRIAPHLPAYEEVAAAVKSDYEAEEKRRLFNDESERIKSELDVEINTGKSFAEAAERLTLKVEEVDTFTAMNAPPELNRSVLQTAQDMKEGEISQMIRSGDTGFFVYLESKEVPEVSDDNEDFNQTKEQLARYGSIMRRRSLINELVTSGLPETE